MKLTKSKLAELIKTQCDLDMTVDKIVKMMFKSFASDDSHFNLTYKGYHLLKYAKFQNQNQQAIDHENFFESQS